VEIILIIYFPDKVK